jgi:hypothetical protein
MLASNIIYGISMVLMLTSWGVGMVNYGKLARQAKLGFWDAYYSFEVYRYAFTEAKGSPETKRMVGGFVGMFVFLFLGIAGAIAIAPAR